MVFRMPKVRRICLVLAISLVLSGFAAWADPPYGGTLTLSYVSELDNLNPILSSDTTATNIGTLLFNGLIHLDERQEVVYDLAKDYEISEDRLTWTFHLKEGITFHDGVELTSEDVLFTYNTILAPENRSPYGSMRFLIDRLETDGRYIFRVILHEPYAPFYLHMNKDILPAHLLEGESLAGSHFNRHPIGTGPFVFSLSLIHI